MAETTLVTAFGFARLRLQIDVYGSQAAQGADAIALAQSIDQIMNGFSGVLPDPDATFVSSCFRIDRHDFFSDTFRTWGRMLEYEILYSEND